VNILGISAFYHDSAAAIVQDGKIAAAAQEERFSRKKFDPSFPEKAIRFCLDETGLSPDELDVVCFYDKPLLKFERLLETYYAYAPRGLTSFIQAMPVWIKEKFFLKKTIIDELKNLGNTKSKPKILFPEHHLSHAASAFYPSPHEEAAILTIDGVGEWATTAICHGKGSKIRILKEIHFPHSIGLLYSAFTYFMGFRVNSGEYKLMGLAPYGSPNGEEVREYIKLIKENLIDIKDDGSFRLNLDYFSYTHKLKMIPERKWEKLFGIPKREPESEITQQHANLAMAIQKVMEEIYIKLARECRQLTGSANLCLAGGVAHNCVANGKLAREKIFDKIFVQPAAGDAGGSIGAALAGYHIYFNRERKPDIEKDGMSGALLGPYYAEKEILATAKKHKAEYHRFRHFEKISEETAKLIAAGNVVGWFQGRMEFGARALGNRSILADPRNPAMQKQLNHKIKFRESFRPFAPAVLEEDVHLWFDYSLRSPYMLFVFPLLNQHRNALPEDYEHLGMKDKLSLEKSEVPAVTHVDFSARVQTVNKENNPRFWQLLQAFKKETGIGVLINTSFNVRGEPIVCTPENAYRCFMRTEMDYLVIENFLFKKQEQPKWPEDEDWKSPS